jgi:PrsW family intramembrane metalloprotease
MGFDALLNRLQWFPIVVWSLVPPFLLLLIYHRRMRAVPSLNGTTYLFGLGMLAGMLAWGLESGLDQLIQALPAALALSQLEPEQVLFSRVLWQTMVVAPAAEACKFAAVVLPLWWLMRRYRQVPAQPSTVWLATIAVALGFAAQTNLVALWYQRAPVINLLLGLPMQAIFSAAWGFALGFALGRLGRYREYSAKWIMHSWLAACLCHGAWNGLVVLSRLPGQFTLPPTFLPLTSAHLWYFLFPWALWLWWQTERMLMRSQGEVAPQLMTATTSLGRFGQSLTILACLGFGGAALYALRDFGASLQDTWALRLTFDRPTAIVLAQSLLRTMILSAIALYLFDRLRQAKSQPPAVN